MRVGISGTHGTGKTTLAQALCAHLPGHVAADEPYYLLEAEGYEFGFPPSPEDYRANPRLSAGHLGQEFPEDRGLASARDSLDREQIGFGVNHRADTPALLCCDVIVSRAAVIPGVLGAVRPYDAVESDRAGDERLPVRWLRAAGEVY